MGPIQVRAWLCLWAQVVLLVEGCRTPTAKPVAPPPLVPIAAPTAPVTVAAVAPDPRPRVAIEAAATEGKLTIGLPEPRTATPPVALERLSQQATDVLLGRLEPLPDVAAAPAPVARPPSTPPHRAGPAQPIEMIVAKGRPVTTAPLPPALEQRVLAPPQIQPTGEVPLEAEIRIRFDEPMVPVARVGDVAVPPAAITPTAPGRWHWLDTRVLVFTTGQLPKATEFTVTVPAGLKAVSGATLATPVTSTFATRPNRIIGGYPTAVLRPDSPIVLDIDQDADAAALLRLITITTDKKQRLAYEPIALDEARRRWAKNPAIGELQEAHLHHPIVLAPRGAWPAGQEIQVQLAIGAPSREGPRLATRESFMRFTVAAPFTLEGVSCDERGPRLAGAVCPAKSYASVVFSNPIEPTSFRAHKLQLDGEPFEDHYEVGNSVDVGVPNKVGHTFAVAIGDGLVDAYGQPFLGPHRATFTASPQHWDATVTARTGMYMLDPRYEIPQWQVTADAITALRVELYRVEPADYFAYELFEAGKRAAPPGKRVFTKSFDIGASYGAHARIDLRPALDHANLGHVIAIARPQGVLPKELERTYAAWIQVSRLGVSVRHDGQRLSAWVSRTDPKELLAPLAGATVAMVREGKAAAERSATTDAAGHTVLELLPPTATSPSTLLVVAKGGDTAFTDLGGAEQAVRRDESRWYVTDDRFLYKPGETVYVKGWIRWTDTGINPALALPRTGERVAYTLTDARGVQLASGAAPLGDQGGFDLEVALPATPNLGMAMFNFTTRGQSYGHPIQIEEFRTPAYSVSLVDDVEHGGVIPLVLGESIEMRAEARYYAGGGLTGATVAWLARLEPASFAPPGWDQYRFAPPLARGQRGSRYGRQGRVDASAEGTLSAASTASVAIGVAAVVPFTPSILEVDSTVADLDRMQIRATSRKILVHPSAYYVGIRAAPGNESRELQVVVTDIDGNAVSGVPIDVAIEGVLGSERWRTDAAIVDAQHCTATSAAAPVPCAWLRGDDKLAYTATARIADRRGRANATQLDIPWVQPERETATLAVVPDKAVYRPGDVAKLDIRSTLLPATAVVSFARQGVISQQHLALTRPSTVVELPIETAYIQNVYVAVDRLATKPFVAGSELPLPQHQTVMIDLPVDRESARLAMTARALRPLVGPGEDATYEVTVRHEGKPVANAEVALMVVDEAVLALAGKRHADPLEPFYRHVGPGTSEVETFSMIEDEGTSLADPPGFNRYKLEDMGYGRSGYGVGGGALGGSAHGSMGVSGISTVVTARKDFRANAGFSPRLHTDASGVVRLTVKMPDNLTRFRVIALATAHTYQFGMAEGTIVTQRKLNARMVPPRFLTQGDRFELPVVVQNLGEAPRTIDVAVRAANLTRLAPAGWRVTVAPGQRAEVRFELATRARGRAALQAIAVSGDIADASTTELSVYEPATTESFATYGIVDDAPQFEQLAVPTDIFPDVGGVEVELASTQLQALTDAYWYLYAYPYECAEQRSARMLATVALDKVLDAFTAAGRPTPQEIAAQRTLDVAKLTQGQGNDGGWGYFRGLASDPYVSMQVVSALAATRSHGAALTRGVAYVTRVTDARLAQLARAARLPAADRKDRDELPYATALAAAGLGALAAAGVDVRARVDRLHAAATSVDAYPIDAKARVLALIAQQPREAATRGKLLAALLAATHETAAGATVTTSYVEAERLLLVSSIKTTALALDAIMREAPRETIIAKLARGLLAARSHGRWRTTQENVAVVQAMRRYFDTYEAAVPSFTGKLWFGAGAYAEQPFQGRSNVRRELRLDWPTLGAGSLQDLSLVKEGAGRMYYRIGITYAPKQVALPALDAGFVVRRTYTAAGDGADVQQRPDGSWHVKLGAKVIVQLEASATTRRDDVALVDPLPAGFEIVNARLAVAERPAAGSRDWSWDFVNQRDNRAEAFALALAEGRHVYQYTVRATTPGTFVAAGAKAEEMYAPETFGRSEGATVVIE